MPAYTPTPSRRRQRSMLDPEFLVGALTISALCGAWLSAVLPVESGSISVGPDGKLLLNPVKTGIYYMVHGLSIASAIGAGLLAAIVGGFKVLHPAARIALITLVIAAAIWGIAAYTDEEIFSREIFGATGPFVWFIVIFALAGTDRRAWKYADPAIRGLAYLTAFLAFRAVIEANYRPFAGFSQYTLYSELLMWTGGWTLLSGAGINGWRILPRILPYLAMIVSAICAQSRSWTVLAILLGLSFLVLRSRERGSLGSAFRTAFVGGALISLAAVAFVYIRPYTAGDSVSGLSRRINEDSRTEQYMEFFRDVAPSELILGRGPKGTWYWRMAGDYQFFDNGYLWMLFIGGVPIFLSYVIVVVWPAVASLRGRLRAPDRAATAMVLFWGLSLTGLSTFALPTVGPASILVALFAGRCHLLLAERARLIQRVQTPRQMRPLPRTVVALAR